MVARRAHNPKVVGSNPAPATRHKKAASLLMRLFLLFSFGFIQRMQCALRDSRHAQELVADCRKWNNAVIHYLDVVMCLQLFIIRQLQ